MSKLPSPVVRTWNDIQRNFDALTKRYEAPQDRWKLVCATAPAVTTGNKIPFDTPFSGGNPAGLLDAAGQRIVTKRAGIYFISWQLRINVPQTINAFVQPVLRINNVTTRRPLVTIDNAGSNTPAIGSSGWFEIAAGVPVDVVVITNNAGGVVVVNSSEETWFEGVRLS